MATAERRLVSVLFADLVGFTTLSESRDSEEVREILSRYFDACRQLVGRYGGIVEKFIGDAVMAVWGTPVAQEDDAERAVRAALDLTEAVSALGGEVGAPELRARAGVLTGEATVTVGAVGEGMVAGDMVNTASRIQSLAPPGEVLVGDATKRATEAAVVHEDAGIHELKGKSEPVRLWRAARVVAGRGGALKATGSEAPFVGRERELRLLKELFHASAEHGRAHLVSVVGIAGIGKSRLAWEFFKYVDGVLDNVWWHRGRCLSYGEGVTYWALAEMVRMRARIAEGEPTESAAAKLADAIETHVPDDDERRWIEPRLSHLLGLEDRAVREKEDLFAAWRLFFERLSEGAPVVMVFEDMQWADRSLLEFIDYLLDWSRNHPIYVIALARPEVFERHPHWGAAKRNLTPLYLEPLSAETMEELLAGLVPGLPAEVAAKILDRAEGVPLYAVETVRMLLDQGLLVQEQSRYRPIRRIEALDVPETLQGLVAARLDGLAPDERNLLQHASVVGKTFTPAALAATSGLPRSELEHLLSSLVRKEVLTVQADVRSPERGQYGFLQDLVRHVAYETLSKKERAARHRAVASYLEEGWGGDPDEIVEVVASHYFQAYKAAPTQETKVAARGALTRAGDHAAGLAAAAEARRYFDEAVALAEEGSARADLLERAGEMAWMSGDLPAATERFQQALGLLESTGERRAAARLSARLGEVDLALGRLDESRARMEQALDVLSGEEPDENVATVAAQLGRLYFLRGEIGLAQERTDLALGIAEALLLPNLISEALSTTAALAVFKGRLEQGLALLEHAFKIACEHDLALAAVRAANNLSETLSRRDRYEDALDFLRQALEFARRAGNRFWEGFVLGEMSHNFFLLGRWDEVLDVAAQIPKERMAEHGTDLFSLLSSLVELHTRRGEPAQAEEYLSYLALLESSEDLQGRAAYNGAKAIALRAEGDCREALAAAEISLGEMKELGPAAQDVKKAFVEAVEAALAIGELAKAEQLVAEIEGLRPGEMAPLLRAHATRFRARLGASQSPHNETEQGYKAAAGMFRELGTPFWLAVTLLEHAEWLSDHGQLEAADPLRVEAKEIFARLKAIPWLERVDRMGAPRVAIPTG